MSFKHLFIFMLCLFLFNCKKEVPVSLNKIEGKRIPISDSLEGDKKIEAFITPFREHINNDLDSVINYSVGNYSPKDGEFENAIGNFLADITYEQANPVFKKRTGKDIDLIVLNNGGIRSGISKGDLTSRIGYKIMPFENSVVVTELKGEQIKELIEYLAKAKRANPIAKLSLKIDEEYNVIEALLNSKPIDYDKTYNVGTIDYLYNGGGGMGFLQNNVDFHRLDYKLRNVIIDYLKKTDTINLTTDGRFVKIHN